MPEQHSFDYTIIRVVPRVERGECLNVGVAVFSRVTRFLDARVLLDRGRLAALAPSLDADELEVQLDHLVAVCRGEPGAGPIAALSPSERFHWLVAPRSTVIQTSPVHSGLCPSPEQMLEHLLETLVALSGPAPR